MKQVPYKNDTDKVVTVGLKSVRPGETRTVDARFVQERPPKFDPDAVLQQAVKDVTANLTGFDSEQLQALLDAEKGGKARKGVIDSISTRILELENELALDDFAKNINEFSREALEQAMLEHKDDEARTAIIQKELNSRS